MVDNTMDVTKLWDYRVVRKELKDGSYSDEWYSIQEVYYDDETGEPVAHTMDLQITGDNIADLRKTLQSMIWALEKDVVTEIKSDVLNKTMEDRVLAIEIENAEMRDRLTELGTKVEENKKLRSL